MVAQNNTEVIFIGLPGCTHHYGGLSADNVASGLNSGSLSNPKQAALQVLELARLVMSLGVTVALVPPQMRPHMPLLRQYYGGTDEEVIALAAKDAPRLLENASSSSSMWVANAATVAACVDCSDGRLHVVTANLFTNLHRRIEAEETYRVFSAIFKDVPDMVVHAPLSAAAGQCDEGAANHMRLAPRHADKGLNIFVYGTDGGEGNPESARQTLSASKAVRVLAGIPDEQALYVRQNYAAIDSGVFHNDVIAVSNENLLLVHEEAYAGGRYDIQRISEAYGELHPGQALLVLAVSEDELTVEEAVQSYLFNSQIVTKPDGTMAIIAPHEALALHEGKAAAILEAIRDDGGNPVTELHYADLRQSMRNGGGPACLRLRVPMSEAQLQALRGSVNVVANDILLETLARLIEKYYPDSLSVEGLGDAKLYAASKASVAEMHAVMRLDQ
jgi:succinylarginine dihydrolase